MWQVDASVALQQPESSTWLLLDANPLIDVTITMRIHAVVRAGRVLDRAERDRLRDPSGSVGR